MSKLFTEEEIEYIKEHYPNESTAIIAKHLNTNVNSIYNKAYRLNIKKSDEYLKNESSCRFQKGCSIGKKTQFKKGHIPLNKGKKMSKDVYYKCKNTMFKKGHEPHNTKYDGCLSIRKSRDVPYIYIRIKKGKWKLFHRFLWEKENGKIPKCQNVVFKDSNQSNVVLSNLEIISDEELLKRNSLHRYPKEISHLIQIKSALQRQINKINKNK